MKREIKFRAWNRTDKHFRYDAQNDVVDISENPRLVEKLNTVTNQTFFAINPIDPNMELMQFTGVKDKTGKEVYEGDVVRQQNQNEFGSFTESIGEVTWCEAHLGFEVRTKNYSPEVGANTLGVNCWVVGNIYENADLLK